MTQHPIDDTLIEPICSIIFRKNATYKPLVRQGHFFYLHYRRKNGNGQVVRKMEYITGRQTRAGMIIFKHENINLESATGKACFSGRAGGKDRNRAQHALQL